MVAPLPINVGDFVVDHTWGLVWKVVDRDDDGTVYIERNNVRSFTRFWMLDPVAPGSARWPAESV